MIQEIKNREGGLIGWHVPCMECSTNVYFHKINHPTTFTPTEVARCKECFSKHLHKQFERDT